LLFIPHTQYVFLIVQIHVITKKLTKLNEKLFGDLLLTKCTGDD